MDFDARVKALARLADSTTDAADQALRKEYEGAATALHRATDYDHLEQSLLVIDTIGFRFSSAAAGVLTTFTQNIDSRALTYSEQDRLFGVDLQSYRNSAALIAEAIQALLRLRYLETGKVFNALMRLSTHHAESVRKKALNGLTELSGYNITVFYGDDQRSGIGAAPQMQLLGELRKLSDPDVITYFPAVLAVLSGVLSPTMESTSWSYKALTLSHTATPAIPTVSEARLQSIELLIHIYGLLKTIDRRLQIIGALTNATRTETRVPRGNEATAMFERDAQKVLAFFAELVATDDLQIVQKIEHNSYWIFHHAISEDVKTAALKVRSKIDERSEYRIYRILVGFEGIFGDWKDSKESEWKNTDDMRRKAADQYVEQIRDGNYVEWRDRILKYAETKSDDLAMFPIFYYFLERLAVVRPTLALRLISDDTEAIRSFLIPLLRGLWSSTHKKQTRALIEAWMTEGRNLYPPMKQFLSNSDLDLELVKRLLYRASEIKDISTIREAVSVAVSNYSSGRQTLIHDLMLPAVELLTDQSNCDWLFDNWFRREMKEVLAALDPTAIDGILRNLQHLRRLDYHAEEVLSIIARQAPDKVLDYLRGRLESESDQASGAFDAIPFELHKLNEPLSKVPDLAVQTLRAHYKSDYSDFMHGGARLLAKIFPNFPAEFEGELLKIVADGGDANLEFVLAILRNYQGELFIHRICKEIVKSIPTDSPFRTEVAIALESTGVVSGEFGMAQAYERKRQEVLEWLTDPDQRVQEFAKWYIAGLERMRDAEQRRAEEDITLRKFRYGEE